MTDEIERRFFKEGVSSVSLLMRRYKMSREKALETIKNLWWKSHAEFRNSDGEITIVYWYSLLPEELKRKKNERR